jgi:hypothetical protein
VVKLADELVRPKDAQTLTLRPRVTVVQVGDDVGFAQVSVDFKLDLMMMMMMMMRACCHEMAIDWSLQGLNELTTALVERIISHLVFLSFFVVVCCLSVNSFII